MSKCGLCGEDFGSESHMVIACKANTIPKALYEKAACWMADYEDPSVAMEEMKTGEEYDTYILESAFDIIYAVYSAHVGEIPLGQRLMEEEENN